MLPSTNSRIKPALRRTSYIFTKTGLEKVTTDTQASNTLPAFKIKYANTPLKIISKTISSACDCSQTKSAKNELDIKFEPLSDIDMINEITPSSDDLTHPLVLDFMTMMTGDSRYHITRGGYVTPEPEASSRQLRCLENVMAKFREPEIFRRYHIVFGFILFVDIDNQFVRCNAHVWLKSHDNDHHDTNRGCDFPSIIDCTPLVDKDEVSQNQYLFECDALFTSIERVRVLQRPDMYRLGSITNKELLSDDIYALLDMTSLNECVGIKAKDLRPVEIKSLLRTR